MNQPELKEKASREKSKHSKNEIVGIPRGLAYAQYGLTLHNGALPTYGLATNLGLAFYSRICLCLRLCLGLCLCLR